MVSQCLADVSQSAHTKLSARVACVTCRTRRRLVVVRVFLQQQTTRPSGPRDDHLVAQQTGGQITNVSPIADVPRTLPKCMQTLRAAAKSLRVTVCVGDPVSELVKGSEVRVWTPRPGSCIERRILLPLVASALGLMDNTPLHRICKCEWQRSRAWSLRRRGRHTAPQRRLALL